MYIAGARLSFRLVYKERHCFGWFRDNFRSYFVLAWLLNFLDFDGTCFQDWHVVGSHFTFWNLDLESRVYSLLLPFLFSGLALWPCLRHISCIWLRWYLTMYIGQALQPGSSKVPGLFPIFRTCSSVWSVSAPRDWSATAVLLGMNYLVLSKTIIK